MMGKFPVYYYSSILLKFGTQWPSSNTVHGGEIQSLDYAVQKSLEEIGLLNISISPDGVAHQMLSIYCNKRLSSSELFGEDVCLTWKKVLQGFHSMAGRELGYSSITAICVFSFLGSNYLFFIIFFLALFPHYSPTRYSGLESSIHVLMQCRKRASLLQGLVTKF